MYVQEEKPLQRKHPQLFNLSKFKREKSLYAIRIMECIEFLIIYKLLLCGSVGFGFRLPQEINGDSLPFPFM